MNEKTSLEEMNRFNEIASQDNVSDNIVVPVQCELSIAGELNSIRESLKVCEDITLRNTGKDPIFEVLRNRIKATKTVLEDALVKFNKKRD